MQSNHNSALPSQRITIALSFICVAALMIMTTGCSALPLASTAGNIVDSPPATAGQYQVKMEFFSGSKMYQGDINGPVTIQDALESSGAIKKFRNMEIDLFRQVDGAYQPLKMAAIYDASKKRVRPETDYGLRAGDSIRVRTKSANPLSKVMGSFAQ